MSVPKSASPDLVLSSPVGQLGVFLFEDKLASITFLPRSKPAKPSAGRLVEKIKAEIKNYFNNPRHCFNLPIHLKGTDFEKTVWKALQEIPCGEVASYQALAQKLKTSPRAIGNACRKNPLPLLIPCHRVVSKTGLGGFSGKTSGKFLDIKKALLNHELNGKQQNKF